MNYVADIIGDDYQNWKAGDSIIISSQTGTGKSTFVLEKLLPNAIAQGKHIVYFCNRKILHEQFQALSEHSLSEILPGSKKDDAPYIHVVTYQYCEKTGHYTEFTIDTSDPNMSKTERTIKDFLKQLPEPAKLRKEDILYYIFDEGHYFTSDSLFNVGTNGWLYQDFSHAVSVYLTATPEPLMWFLYCKGDPYWYDFKNTADQIVKRSKIRASLEKPRTVKYNSTTKEISVPMKSQSFINDECRKIQPYREPIETIKSGVRRKLESVADWRLYNCPLDYSYVTPYYFSDYTVLLDEIKRTRDKWLIFIDMKEDGIDLVARLDQMGVTAVYLSAETRRDKDTDAYQECCNIVKSQKYSCKVLVATSVLDCGVSISDSSVKNIVIGHSEKTTFLQMLGRRRVHPGESLNLYIKNFSATTINSFRYMCEQQIQFLTFFQQRNEIDYDKVQPATAESDGMRARTKLTASRINQMIEHLPENRELIYAAGNFANAWYGPFDRIKNATGTLKVLEEYEISQTALIGLLYQYDLYWNAVENHRKTKDPVFYLKLQLSWVGKTYDRTHWFGYEEAVENMRAYLDNYATSQRWLDKTEQEDFSRGFLRLLEKYPAPLQKIKMTTALREEKKGKLPGKNKLEKVFQDIGLPYHIKTKQPSKGNRQMQWRIVPD